MTSNNLVYIYFDASTLVKRYSSEDGTELVNEVFIQHPIEQITCAMIGVLEIISVLVRKQNDGRLSSAIFSQAMLQLKKEIIDNKAFSIASLDDSLILSSIGLIGKYNINATDAIILRSCLNINQELKGQGHKLVLISSDKRLIRAAMNEKIDVIDPEIDTVSRLQSLLNVGGI